MNREPTRIEELKAKLAMAQDDLSIRTAELERVESKRDALQARVNRLEEALVAADKYIDEIQADDNGDYHTWVVNVADARTAYNFAKQTAKESKP